MEVMSRGVQVTFKVAWIVGITVIVSGGEMEMQNELFEKAGPEGNMNGIHTNSHSLFSRVLEIEALFL